MFAILSISLMVADHKYQKFHGLKAAISVAVYPIRTVINLPVATGSWINETLKSRETLLEENSTLRKQQLLLRAQLQRFEALENENLRLRHLLDSTLSIGKRLMIAEILAVDLDPYKRHITINKGSSSDVYLGQPVLDATGILGQISEVGPLTATALLITDVGHAIPVQVNRNGLRAIVSGTGQKDQLQLLYVPNNADVVEGDTLVTSGLGGRFPPGYPVGKVTQFMRNPAEAYAEVEITPSAQMESGREVLLIWPETHADSAIEATSEGDTGA